MTAAAPLLDGALLDGALRGALVATLLIVAAALARERPLPAVGRVALALQAGLVVQTIASTPLLERGLPILWQAPLIGLSVGNSVLFWLFARALFDDDFTLRPRHWAIWAAVVAIGGSFCFSLALVGSQALLTVLLRILLRWLPACFAVLVIGAAAWQWRGDLVERRRRWRSFIVVAGSAYTVAMVAARLAAPQGLLSPAAAGVDNAALLLIVLVSAIATLRLSGGDSLLRMEAVDLAGGTTSTSRSTGTGAGTGTRAAMSTAAPSVMVPAVDRRCAPPSPGRAAEAPPDAKQEQLADALDRLMRIEHVYRVDDLTLGLLALKLGVPEYRLRRCIHERLGYRNFNAYINTLRLAQAREELADPARRGTSVTDIAMAAGFASLGPFNRAFKAAGGLTPSEFRLRALADS